ncbi:uncharacterized protein N7483_003231 [Penicillium malachiteum]|uniref:uncharacterized protein n=1 Tax=Penicillium malachiteum TaxID=1324776 RepID=UPI0025470749|nr:uncharacterized protein N7483_003231 [Penicillium malachiteum]KAJ5728723.1 hypothetical protein N7483_003231 [Penicillium malachiteum]
MDVESCVELPDGHLVNLSPRPQSKTKYQAYRAHYTASEASTNSPARNCHLVPPTELEDRRLSDDIMFQNAKTTKLPVPKSVSDRARDQRNQTPSPTGIPKLSSVGFSSGGSAGPSGERDPYWRKIRDRFEKESPLSQRASYVRSRESDRARSKEAAESWQHEKYPARTSAGDKPASRSQTAIPSPNTNNAKITPSVRHNLARDSEPQKKWRVEGAQWISPNSRDKSDLTDTTSDSSPHSNQSISPVSADDSMTDCDWEDRFVVHMPSAKDPNPPTMTEDQIAEYQRSIEKKRRYGRGILDSNTRPSPRSSFGDERRDSSTHREKRRVSDQSKINEIRESEPQQTRQQETDRSASQTLQVPGSQAQGHYYSPDEVGKNRISTIWEESPSKTKEKRLSHTADGSFLGCKEINGPKTRNPDEILLFASGEDSTTLHPRPLAVGAKKRLKEKAYRATRKSEEVLIVQEEWPQISQNSKHAQCLKPSSATMCQESTCREQEVTTPDSQGSSKENSRPRASMENLPGRLEDGRSEDDVFIITPTITRTMIPTATPEKKEKAEKKVSVFKVQGLRRPGGTGQSGTGEAVKAVRAKAQVISTPLGLRPATGPAQPKSRVLSLTSSKGSSPKSKQTTKEKATQEEEPKDNIQKSKETATPEKGKSTPEKAKEKAEKSTNSIRGFIRTSGLARSTGLVRSPTGSLATILRNGTESLRNRAESFRNGSGSLVNRKDSSSPVSQISPPSRDNSESSRSDRSFRSAKESPPSSTKPSPVKKETRTARVSLEKPPPREKSPAVEPQPPPKKPTPPPPPEKRTTEKPASSDKFSQAERLARAERLERFKEQARARRAMKVVEIAELDGQQVSGSKDNLQANITDVRDDLGELDPVDTVDKDDEPCKETSNSVALSLIFEIVLMAITNMHRFGLETTDSPYVKFMIVNVLNMVRHCYHVFSTIYQTVTVYQNTGTWPKARNDQAISRFLVELLQAAVYLIILGFGCLVLSRAAGYILLVGSWILWFAKPFAWGIQSLTRALIT